jgi:hypothetical protein
MACMSGPLVAFPSLAEQAEVDCVRHRGEGPRVFGCGGWGARLLLNGPFMDMRTEQLTPGVSRQQQSRASTVAASSRCGVAIASLLVGVGWSGSAAAMPPNGTPSTHVEGPAPITPSVVPQRQSYAGLLGTAYLVAPVLALAVGATLAQLEVDDTYAVLGGVSMFLLPAAVHIGYGNEPHGPFSFFALGAVTTVGIVVGGFIGLGIDSASCRPEEDSEGCDFAGLNGLVAGALIGALLGYTAYAVYDVGSNASVAGTEPTPSPRASLQPWLRPLSAPRSLVSQGSSTWDGFQLGATLRM